jgi:hypothetical protein
MFTNVKCLIMSGVIFVLSKYIYYVKLKLFLNCSYFTSMLLLAF